MFGLGICRIAEVLFDAFLMKFNLWKEAYLLEKQGKPVASRAFAEEQGKYSEFRMRQQIENMLQLVLALGYVLIFGAVVPLLVPLCLVEFIVQLRASAFLLTLTAKRAVPNQQTGI